jgi:hypothetical protein
MVFSLNKMPAAECGASWGANTWEISINKGGDTDYSATHRATRNCAYGHDGHFHNVGPGG